jgi:hypothetical protein
MTGETNLETLVRSMTPRQRPGEFVFVTFPTGVPAGLAVEATIAEDEGVTAVVSRNGADDFGLEYSFVAAWITLDIHSGLEAVGLTGAFSTALAAAGVSCNVLAGYFHDHILVPVADSERVLATLRGLAAA